jgi:hypothetical protein
MQSRFIYSVDRLKDRLHLLAQCDVVAKAIRRCRSGHYNAPENKA